MLEFLFMARVSASYIETVIYLSVTVCLWNNYVLQTIILQNVDSYTIHISMCKTAKLWIFITEKSCILLIWIRWNPSYRYVHTILNSAVASSSQLKIKHQHYLIKYVGTQYMAFLHIFFYCKTRNFDEFGE